MKISEILGRGNNNFDVLRLVAAAGVIVGHAYTIAPQEGKTDWVLQMLEFDYSGSLAVRFFFFLSGMLVAKSLLGRPSLIGFLVSRSFRLFPALVVCTALSAFVLGPVFTKMPWSTYFKDGGVFQYVWSNSLLNLQWELPGVFSGNPVKAVNGSLWTLPIEFFCYVFLAAIGAVGALKSRIIGSLVLIGIVGALIYRPQSMDYFGLPGEAYFFPVFFALGVLFSLHADVIDVNARFVLGWVLLAYLLRFTVLYQYVCSLAIFLCAIWLSTISVVKSWRLPGDFSYGIYLYGFPMQQISKSLWPTKGVYFNQLSALILALGFAVVSWFLIEKKFIDMAANLRRRFSF